LALIVLVSTLLQFSTAGPNSGVTYTRWGRTTCPIGATAVYKGWSSGGSWNEAGSGVNYLCAPEKPQWGVTVDGLDPWTGFLYGVKYRLLDVYGKDGALFSFANNYGQNINAVLAPCVVCYQPVRTDVLMLPAQVNCSSIGWNTEYTGYIVSADRNQAKSMYVCLDAAPEVVPGGLGDVNEQMFCPVQVQCGSLNCPPYTDSAEVACAVCTI